MNTGRVHKRTNLAIYVVIVMLVLGCQVSSGSSAVPTPSIPLSDVDLSWAATRLDELPSELELKPSESLSKLDDMRDLFPDHEAVYTNVVSAQYTGFSTEDRHHFYSNGIFVYADTTDTIKAFEQISGGWTDQPETVSNLGDNALALYMESDKLHKITILWRYQEALVYLSILGRDSPAPPLKEVIQSAKNVQSRLEQRSP